VWFRSSATTIFIDAAPCFYHKGDDVRAHRSNWGIDHYWLSGCGTSSMDAIPKLHLASRTQAALYALREGYVPLHDPD